MGRHEQAAQCWRSLPATLRSVHEFTSGSTTAAGLLLHRMNAVLWAAVDTNYGARSLDAIVALYELITVEQPGMAVRCEELPLLLFSRSFAVVLEETVRPATVSNPLYRSVMSCEQAALYRRELQRTLSTVDEFTTRATTASGLLLHCMNAVLRAVVDCNFGSGSYDSIGELYESIDREQLGMIERCEDLPRLLFARSFAVVMQEAVRQRVAATATIPDSPHIEVLKVLEIRQAEEQPTVPPNIPPRTESTLSESSYASREDKPSEKNVDEKKKGMILAQCTVPIASLRPGAFRWGETPVLDGSSDDDSATATMPRCPDNTASEASWSGRSTPNEETLMDERELEGGEWYNHTPSITPAPSTARLDEGELRDTEEATVPPPAGDTVSCWSCDTPCEDQLIWDDDREEDEKEEGAGATAAAAAAASAEVPPKDEEQLEKEAAAAEARLFKQLEYRAAQKAAFAIARFEFRSDVRTMNMETMVVGSSDEEEDDVVVDDGWKGGS
ncbi:hypothetical protein PRIPAC_86287 [Pristionchus pacificus]|uniref:Uncharacterized protein n=1 Tax=Pristionchus pacificus TaxID=54126 RepID=A0A2A6BM32_PRIPA|nr:hypothetical protein PRIPAC_86287 [Pristionchus pacificus]|eukprot:PDM66957.1 hypothetical protein PRIPAC_48374 [Pristionchus pacificus]